MVTSLKTFNWKAAEEDLSITKKKLLSRIHDALCTDEARNDRKTTLEQVKDVLAQLRAADGLPNLSETLVGKRSNENLLEEKKTDII